MSDRYWISTPGSNEPPTGPLTLPEITSLWTSQKLDPAATMCKVGDAVWVSFERVLAPPKPPQNPFLRAASPKQDPPTGGAPVAEPLASEAVAPASAAVALPVTATAADLPEARDKLAVRRAALTTGATALEVNATVFQIVAVVMLVGGVIAMNVPQDSLMFPKWQVVMGVVAATAPFAYATGLILRALSEVLLALRDGLEK